MTDLALVPGGMQRSLRRVIQPSDSLPGGVAEFEEAPVGWLTKTGSPRKTPWRAYFWQPTDGRRQRFASVTTLLDDILPKDGLPRWSEGHGIRGGVRAVREGLIGPDIDLDEAVEIVRRKQLGADAARDEAAGRGLNVHGLLEEYMRTGSPPSLSGQPDAHRGYITALARSLMHLQPDPVAIEQLVVHPEDGYAGRLDLRARLRDGRLATIDYKTSEKAAIYPHAHFQVCLYERAAVRCGAEPADTRIVVVLAADGQFRVMPADHEDWRIDAALLWRRALAPVSSVCESANRAERDARKPAPGEEAIAA